jgi:hypothetical protein
MFDTNTTYTIPLRLATGKTDITVRWPTDEEWFLHRKRRRILQRQMGRGAHTTELDDSAADPQLYEAIKLNGAPPLTPAEANFIVSTISTCNILGVELHADDAEVKLETATGPVTHTLRIPSMDQVRKLENATQLISLPYNLQQFRPSLEASANLWDQCSGRVEGYVGAVPNIHKDVAIRNVITALQQEAAPKYDEGNF